MTKGCDCMKQFIALLLALSCVPALVGCSKTDTEKETAATTENMEVVTTTEPTAAHTLDCQALQAACADGFIDPSKVTVLGGEWAYTADPNKFVALATVRYTDKDGEYETTDFLMLGVFGGEIERYHMLNAHSPYTRENGLQEFGAVDDRRFPLE